MARSRGAPDDAQKARLTPAWRRWEQAAETLDTAQEAEDFQAVGVKCRECLIQLVRSLAKSEMAPPGEEAPQRSNFISWSELIANTVAGGASAERVRGHLKATAKSAWELAGWLTHANGATRQDAVFVLDATHTVLAAFGQRRNTLRKRQPRAVPELWLVQSRRGIQSRVAPTLRIRVRGMWLANSGNTLSYPGLQQIFRGDLQRNPGGGDPLS